MEEWTQNAPAGSDAAVDAMKHAIASANTVYESSQKAVKHAVQVAQTNLHAAANPVKATKKKS